MRTICRVMLICGILTSLSGVRQGVAATLAAVKPGVQIVTSSDVLFNDPGRYRVSGRYSVLESESGDRITAKVICRDILGNLLPDRITIELDSKQAGWNSFSREFDLPRWQRGAPY